MRVAVREDGRVTEIPPGVLADFDRSFAEAVGLNAELVATIRAALDSGRRRESVLAQLAVELAVHEKERLAWLLVAALDRQKQP
jgi:hypothetical protein